MRNSPSYIYLNLLIIFISSWSFAEEINYQFSWLKMPVARLKIDFNNFLPNKSKTNISEIKFKLFTEGPLKIYRNYSSEGFIKKNSSLSWDYSISGQDRGQLEQKSITYFTDKAPIINKFIDDAGVLPIYVDSDLDRNALDPFSVLTRTIDQLVSDQRCNNVYSVMDGKRRYKISVDMIEKTIESKNNSVDTLFYCKFTFSQLKEEPKKWPFNRKDRYLDVWFSSNLNYKPVRFYSKTPIGSVIGSYIRKK